MKLTKLQHLRVALIEELDKTLRKSEQMMKGYETLPQPLSENELVKYEWHKNRYSKAFDLHRQLLEYCYE